MLSLIEKIVFVIIALSAMGASFITFRKMFRAIGKGAQPINWKDALSNVMPHVEVRSRRVGGATFQIPMQIRADRKVSLAMKWLITSARKRNEKSMALRLANECIAAEKEEGSAVKKRVDTHKMAEANKAFSHFRF